jgi:flavin-dependent dehydrogenase
MKSEYDCLVIGGGPAGSTVATLVAEAGFSTALVEREKVPRFHVGESLMPETYWTFERLGVLDKMKQSNFVKKVSVQFVSHKGHESQPFYFQEHDPRDCAATWQVERADFDKMLFDNAAEKGAECFDETRVLETLLDGQRATGVKLQTTGEQLQNVAAKVVVDATGQQALIANRLGLKVENPYLKKAAIWGYYENARRDPGENGGATIILQTSQKKSWFWFIPLSNNVSSVGVVGDRDYVLKGRGQPADVFAEELSDCPALMDRLTDAKLVSDVRTLKEFSYSTKKHAGDGWVLVGDAWGFIDPIYSSGVYFALRSGELAADAIVEGLRANDVSGEQLGKWARDFGAGTQWIRKLVGAFYTSDFSFGRFMKEHPEYKGDLTDLLIGRIFHDSAGRIFKDMDPALRDAINQSSV